MIRIVLLLSFTLVSAPNILFGQVVYNPAAESEMVIKGSSSLHDWESQSGQINGQLTLEKESTNQLQDIQKMKLSIPVKSFESGKDGLDKNMYEALSAEEHPTITFRMTGFTKLDDRRAKATGDLTVAGQTRQITVTGNYNLKNGQLTIRGNKTIDMTNYDIEPPTFLLGAFSVDEEVTVAYELKFSK